MSIYDIAESTQTPGTVYVQANAPLGVQAGQQVTICGTGTYTAAKPPKAPCGSGTAVLNGYDGIWAVTAINLTVPASDPSVTNYGFPANFNFTFTTATTGLADILESQTATAGLQPEIDRSRGPAPDHGCRRHERKHPGPAGGI